MRLTEDRLLTYPGFHGTRGICHVRVYKSMFRRPVVIVGDFPGTPWTSVTNAAEAVAGEIQHELLDGRGRFRLVEYAHLSEEGHGRFLEITFTDGDPKPQGKSLVLHGGRVAAALSSSTRARGRFTRPRARGVDVETLIGQSPQKWGKDDYTPENVAADRDAALLLVEEIRRHNSAADADLDAREDEFFTE